jgi:hypothetical protein
MRWVLKAERDRCFWLGENSFIFCLAIKALALGDLDWFRGFQRPSISQ